MRTKTVEASRVIQAPAERVYGIIADYRDGHPRILPPPFGKLEVEEGGVGAGTVIRCEIRAFGKMQTFRAAIAEPEPGRVLLERELARGTETRFIVDPVGGGCRATISSEVGGRGVLGIVDRLFMPRFLRPIYAAELEKLAAVAESAG